MEEGVTINDWKDCFSIYTLWDVEIEQRSLIVQASHQSNSVKRNWRAN